MEPKLDDDVTIDDCRALMAGGHIDAGLAAMERLVAASQSDPALLWLEGESLRAAGRPRAAADVFRRLVDGEPRSVAARIALAEALAATDAVGEAIDVAQMALALSPRDIPARHLLADVLGQAGLWGEASAVIGETLAIVPDDASTWLRAGQAALALGNVDAAGRAYTRSLALAPDLAEARLGQGRVALRSGRLQQAIELLGERLTLQPETVGIRLDLLEALRRADLFAEGRRLLSPEVVGPAAPDPIRVEAARLALATGVWRDAFADFDRRSLPRLSDRPRWSGAPSPAERLLVIAEDSEADSLAFARFLPLFAARLLSVVLAAPATLRARLADLPGCVGTVAVVDIAALPAHDVWLPLASAPAALGLRPEDILPPLPLPARATVRAKVLAIGVALGPSPWSPVPDEAPRDIVLALRRAFPYARFVALDKAAAAGLGLAVDVDAVRAIADLDLVVATDGPLAHAAGVQRRPLWLLLDCACHWMWGRQGRLSRWYPTARLFRASGPAWQGVADAVAAELAALVPAGLTDAAALRRLAEVAAGVGGEAALRSALPLLARAVALLADDPAPATELSELLSRLDEGADADRALDMALAVGPRHVPALLLKGRRDLAAGDAAAALRRADLALSGDPASIEALMLRAAALTAGGESGKAEFTLRQAVLRAPRRPDLLVAWGDALLARDDPRAATRAFERAAIVDTASVEARLRLGRLAASSGAAALASHFLRTAHAFDPGHVEAAMTLAAAADTAGRSDEALSVLSRLVARRPAVARAHARRGELMLARGDFKDGGVEFEWRHGDPPRDLPALGAIAGSSVRLQAEGSAVAMLTLARFARRLRDDGATAVVIDGAGPLAPLLACVDGVDAVDAPPDGGFELPMLSLPRLFAVEPATLPAPRRYLRPDPVAVTEAAKRLAGIDGVRIGVALDSQLTAADLGPLLAIPGLAVIALDAAAASLSGAHRLDSDGAAPALVEIAAAAMNLDAVVTLVDNPVAALAGALGKPAFVLAPAATDWLWLAARGRTPWFPATRLFQAVDGDWSDAIRRLAVALAAFAGGNRAVPYDVDRAASGGEARSAPSDGKGLLQSGSPLAVATDDAAFLSGLGLAALDSREDHRAILLLGDALAAGAAEPQLRDRLAAALLRVGDHQRARDLLAALAAEAPTAERLADLSEVDRQAGRLVEALANAERAVALRPDLARAFRSVGRAAIALGRVDAALDAFGRAVALAPTDPELLLDEAEALLASGDYRRGFARYEVRWQAAELLPRRFDVPRWTGEDIGGRTLLIHGEQGLGDQISFARFLPPLLALGGHFVVEVRPALVDLFRRLDLGDAVTVVEHGRRLPPHDIEVPLLSLPHIFATDIDTLPPPAAFRPDPRRVEAWQGLVGAAGSLRIGLHWRVAAEAARFARLFRIDGLRYFALHRRDGRAGLAALPRDASVTALGDRLMGFAETAAALTALDLVIAPPSATAHLAGSLGRPTIVVDPAATDWQWRGVGDGTPWYPSVRSLRRRGDDDDLATRLADLVRERAAS